MLIFGCIYLSKNPEKIYSTVLNINNNNNLKRFLKQQLSISELFLKDNVTQGRSNDAENSALITEINYILQYIQIESFCT